MSSIPEEYTKVYPTKDGFNNEEEEEYFICWELQRLASCLNPHAKRNTRIAICSYFACLAIAIFMIVIAIISAILMHDLNLKMSSAQENMDYVYKLSQKDWGMLIAGGQLVELNNFWVAEFFVQTAISLQNFLWNDNAALPWPQGSYQGSIWPTCPVESQLIYPGGCEELYGETLTAWNIQNGLIAPIS